MKWNPDIARVIQRAVARTLLVGGAGTVGLACGGSTTAVSEASNDELSGDPSEATASGGAELTENGGAGGTETTSNSGIGGAETTSGGATGESTNPTTEKQPLLPLDCPAEEASRFSLMNLEQPYDFIAIRSTHGTIGQVGETSNLMERDAQGACDADCVAAVGNLSPSSESQWATCGQICSFSGVVTYFSDARQGEMLETKAQLLALLGTIDTPHEAAFWADVNGNGPGCGPESQLAAVGAKYKMIVNDMIAECPIQYAEVTLEVSPNGTIAELSRVVLPETGGCIGRRPEGLAKLGRSDTGCAVGDYFAEVAQLEEAAVEAFRVIVLELKHWDAPQALIEQALIAYLDEIRHTAQTGALARRFGAQPQSPQCQPRELRELFAFALDNAVEGCVRETFGAAYARHQASTAGDFEVRRVLRQIASDEERHASLSWQMHQWAMTQLSGEQQQAIFRAQRVAVEQLRAQVDEQLSDEVHRVAGVPDSKTSLAIIHELTSDLWDQALAA